MNTQPRHPKCRALPVEPHPVIHFSAIIPRRGRKSKIFLSVVIPVVKAAFMPLSTIVKSPANTGVTRLCDGSHCPAPDTAAALPKQARYQLRYTRLYIVGLSGRPHSIPYSAPVFKSFLHRRPQKECRTTIHLGQLNKKGMRNRASCVKVELSHQTF